MNNVPVFVDWLFGFTTAITAAIFYKASHNSRFTLGIIVGWLLLQAIVAYTGFYTVTNSMPPRFVLLVGPPLILIALLFFTRKGRNYLDTLDHKMLILLHTVRIPVEITLYFLFVYEAVPRLMTFEGRNLDILSGLTAPLMYYLVFIRKTGGRKLLIGWNIVCLVLLFNIVINAVLAAPFPFQQFAFDRPNVGVLYFPFVWLPGFIVPLVLLSHLVSLRQLLVNNSKQLEAGMILK